MTFLKNKYFVKLICVITVVAFLSSAVEGTGFVPYYTYTYDHELKVMPSSAGYLPEFVISDPGDGTFFSNPQDLYFYNGIIYICDTGNSRIVATKILDDKLEYVCEIGKFINNNEEDSLKLPIGICVTNDELYVADTENGRIVVFNLIGEFIKIIPAPQIDVFSVEVGYKPQKIGVDKTGRIFVVSQSVTEGLIQIDQSGNFIRFYGGNRVNVDFYELMLRFFLTKEQRSKRLTFIPVEYNKCVLDEKDFVYVSTSKAKVNQVKRLNTQGLNILRADGRTKDVYGDIHYTNSNIIDIAVGESGNYYVLDNLRGRIFQYNELGDLLNVFGGMGVTKGTFSSPSSIEYSEDGRVFVADSVKNTITVFRETDFGALVNKANDFLIEGKYVESMEIWEKVLKLNSNYDLAYIGMGNAYMQINEYGKAMKMFETGKYKPGYSKAYEEYRNEVLSRYFPVIMTSVVVLIILFVLLKKRIISIVKKISEFVDA